MTRREVKTMPRQPRRIRLAAAGAPVLLAAIVGAGCSSSPGDSTACGQTIADYCAQGGSQCDSDLSAARSRWQTLCGEQPSTRTTIATGCGPWTVVTLLNGDSETVEFYGPNSDQLGAVTKSGPPDGEAVCVAGPGSFVVPSCGQAAVETCPGVDAGAD
ncbi:MAG TPA: hypothetical protein VIY73_07725 [Polyangiaceae bacterium]